MFFKIVTPKYIHFLLLVLSLGGGGKYISGAGDVALSDTVDWCLGCIGPKVIGVLEMPGLRRAKVAVWVAGCPSGDRSGRSFVPPNVLKAMVLGVEGLMPFWKPGVSGTG